VVGKVACPSLSPFFERGDVIDKVQTLGGIWGRSGEVAMRFAIPLLEAIFAIPLLEAI
jgi:hypothetical protein